MTLSQLALEDVEALCFGPSFLTADPMGPLLDQDEEEEALSPSSSSSLQGKALASSPSSSSPSTPSSLSPYQVMSFSPPPGQSSSSSSSPALQSLPWLVPGDLLHSGVGDGDDDAFAGMDWMSEKIDLSEFDLDSLMGSSPGSPEDLLASLDSHMDLGLDSLELSLSLPAVPPLAPEPQTTVKCEPPSPAPAPADTLELGSEVDVLEAEKTAPPVSVPAPVVLSVVPPAHFLVVPVPDQKPSSDCDSDSGIESVASSPPRQPSPPPPTGSSRTKPYFKPSDSPAPAPAPRSLKMKSAPRVVEKKLKKMEQNKTAATRYRQKKRVEQELLLTECQELEDRNRQLAEKAESISREIQYLRDLMEEVRKHRRGKTGSAA